MEFSPWSYTYLFSKEIIPVMAKSRPRITTSLELPYHSSKNAAKPNPEHCMAFRNYLGMIMLV